MPHPHVSVIVPVLDDSARLKICLHSLENQTYPKNRYEVIVVDNGSKDDIRTFVSRYNQSNFANEIRRSSYAARNKGISIAKGQVIAFTDSDCIPAKDWIEKGVVNLLRIPKCGLVAGRIEIAFKNPNQPTAVELYESIVAFPQELFVEAQRFGATANLFTFRSAFNHVGIFNDNLQSGGDMEWGNRVYLSGLKLIYANDTVVLHPSRNSLTELYKKNIRVAGGQHKLIKESKEHTLGSLQSNILEEVLPSIMSIKFVIKNEKFKRLNLIQRMKIILIGFSLRYLRTLVKLRLQLSERLKV